MEILDTSADAMRPIMERIEKLMRLAGNNDNEHQAAMALAKAQELLSQYNLDIATVEKHSGESGKREEQRVMGGMSVYQRNLWRAIAELNFCFHWVMKVRAQPGSLAAKRGRKHTHEHKLVGRTVNVRATMAMADYLEKTIERLCRDKLGDNAHKEFFSRWAISFREGIADRVIEKIDERRWDQLEADKKKRAAQEAAMSKQDRESGSTSTALTIFDLTQQERDANMDFMYGEGYTAKQRKESAERQQRHAEAQAKAERDYVEWAAANPEKARKMEEKQRKDDEKEDRRWRNRRHRWANPKERPRDHGAYSTGYDAGEKVSIDQQVSSADRTTRRIK